MVEDPPESIVLEAAALARASAAEAVVGLGGGSSMDVAKLVAVLAHPSCEQPLQAMYGVGQVTAPRLPLVQVPTTAGTGSEVTPISILTTGECEKKGVVSPTLLPDVAVLDGELLATVPRHVAAATGIDAMVHAIEAYTSARKNPLSDTFGREALKLLSSNIHAVCGVDEPPAGGMPAARSAMMLGACYAGMAFANAPVAAVHALAYPLGSHFHVAHGLSNSLMLPHVLGFNAAGSARAAEQYAELAHLVVPRGAVDAIGGGGGAAGGADRLIRRLAELPVELGLPTRLADVGVAAADIPMIAAEAMKQTRLLPNNPTPVGLADAQRLYEAAL